VIRGDKWPRLPPLCSLQGWEPRGLTGDEDDWLIKGALPTLRKPRRVGQPQVQTIGTKIGCVTQDFSSSLRVSENASTRLRPAFFAR